MRAVVIHQHGGVEVLKIEDRPIPEPGEFDLLVEVHASSVNPVDTRIRQQGTAPRSMPITLGFDASGIVVKCGTRVHGFKPGDQVFGCPNLFGNGAQAEFALLDSRAAAHKPKAVDHATAATLPLVSLTAWQALHERARIEAGQTVLIQAGAGGVGHIAVQLARLHGCQVLTTAGRPESISFCKNTLKADEVIDYSTTDVAMRINELTNGRGVPVAFDTVGGDVFKKTIPCVAPFGNLVTITRSNADEQATMLLMRSISVHYEFMGARVVYGVQPERQGNILRSVARLVDSGLLTPYVSQRLPLDRIADAHRSIESRRTIGKIAVVVR